MDQQTTEKELLLQNSTNKATPNQQHQHRKLPLAYAFALVSVIAVSISLPCVQILDGIVPDFELNAWRFGAQVALILPVVLRNKCDVSIPLRSWPVMLIIFALYTVFNWSYYTAALYLPVGTLDGLNNAIVISANVLLSVCVKTERKIYMYASAVISIVGILLLTQPGFIFETTIMDTSEKLQNQTWVSPCSIRRNTTFNSHPNTNSSIPLDEFETARNSQYMGYILITVAGISTATALQLIHLMLNGSTRPIAPATIAFWVGVAGTIGSLVAMGIKREKPSFPHGALCVSLLFLHAFGVGQSSLAAPYCLKHLSPSVFSLINSLHLVFLFVFQFTFLSPIQPGHGGNVLEIFGAVLAVIGGVLSPAWQLVVHVLNKDKF